MPGAHRQVLLPPHTRLPELAMLGRSRQSAVDGLGLQRHRHPGAWELCWFAGGAADWWVGGEMHELSAGWCYLTRPDEEHGSLSGVLEACDLHWLILAVPDGRLPGLAPADAEQFAASLARAPHAFPAPGLGPGWEALWAAATRRDALAVAAQRTALHQLLLAALHAVGQPPPPPPPAVRRALARADEGHATVAALARAAGLGRSAFHHRFRTALGDSPAAWLRRRRLAVAKRQLLATDQPVTAIAHAAGYATSQRFATAFRETTGITPQAWRQRARAMLGG